MPTPEQLKRLFVAFRDNDEVGFRGVAEAIIADELAANHHALAHELTSALRASPPARRTAGKEPGLRPLPRDRRFGEDLITLQPSNVDQARVILSPATEKHISRLLEEQRQKRVLARRGFRARSKVLFYGPPGCGKTLTARYVAHELDLPVGLLRLNAVISSFLGDTASHLQRVFDLAGQTPMVLLLDEIDAVGKQRDDPHDVGELKRVVSSLLQAMDGFAAQDSIVIAATNHEYLLDPAVWRRFDDAIHFPMPGRPELERLARWLMNGLPSHLPAAKVAAKMSGFSFADAERIVVEAVKTAIMDGRDAPTWPDLTEQLAEFRDAARAASPAGSDGRGTA